jgi:hypothetical protein
MIQARAPNQTPSSLVCAASAARRRRTARAAAAASSRFSVSLVLVKPRDPLDGRGYVRAVVDGLADIGEADAREPSGLQDLRHGARNPVPQARRSTSLCSRSSAS